MSTEANKQLLRQYHAAWSSGDTQALRQLLTDDCINHNLATGETRGVEFEVEACQIWHRSFTDVHVSVEHLVAEGDKVTVYWQLRSVHSGKFLEIDATGKIVNVPGMEINRILDGKIAEIWRLSDTMSLMQQLGAV